VYSVLQELTAALSAALTPQQVADVIVTKGLTLVGGNLALVCGLTADGQSLEILNKQGFSDEIYERYRYMPIDVSTPLGDALRIGEPIWIETIGEYIQLYPQFEENIRANGSQAAVYIPLVVGDQPIGAMSLSFPIEYPFDKTRRQFLTALAHQCAQALDRARLFEAERRARKKAETAQKRLEFLAQASTLLASSLDYQETLQNVAELVAASIADWCGVYILHPDKTIQSLTIAHKEREKVALAYRLHELYPSDLNQPYGLGYVLSTGQLEVTPVITDEAWRASAQDEQHLEILLNLDLHSLLIVPIVYQQTTIGALTMASATPGHYEDQGYVTLAQELAQRAAMAIKNAQLYQQAQEAAVLAERQRLARELHDAVTQTLFASSMIAGALTQHVEEGNVEKVRPQLTRLLRLNRGALAEMRALLLELRQVDLVTIELPELIRQLADIVMGHYSLDVELQIDGVPYLLPADVHTVFYRVAQETLHNVSRHARAKTVQGKLAYEPEQVYLEMVDDGSGFDPLQVSTDHLGLRIMQERAESIGAQWWVHSAPGQGTQIQLIWPRNQILQ
jgi:signal transduction histidine kinase